MPVTRNDIEKAAVLNLQLNNKPVCIHSSLRSFGWVEGGAKTIIEAFLNQGCTILVPTFSSSFAVDPPLDKRPIQNGCDYNWFEKNKRKENNVIYTQTSNELDNDMGSIPSTILAMKDRIRGNHPLNSFTAIGSFAVKLISEQEPKNVYAPLKTLAELGGSVVLMGVDLNRLTLLHLAEQMAGRNLFHRWAKDSNGETIAVEVGGCSEGFQKFEDRVSSIVQEYQVGESLWRVFDATEMLSVTQREIERNPLITHCGEEDCERCNDAIKGGRIL